MAYTKQTWSCGDEITAEKLNHIEDGIENAGGDTLVVRVDRVEGQTTYYDHTWQEVHDAIANGQRCVFVESENIIETDYSETVTTVYTIEATTSGIENDTNYFNVTGYNADNSKTLNAETADSPLTFVGMT